MKRATHSKPPSVAELTALADGSLPAAERARVQRAVDASPELQASVLAQRRALAAIDDNLAFAPSRLRARIASVPGSSPAAVRHAHRRRVAGTLAASIATVAVTLAAWLAIAGGFGPGTPTVAQASLLALSPPQAAVPSGAKGSVTLPRVRAAGLPYPYWEDRFGYRASGVRHDHLAGRSATTVFYTGEAGEEVAYTIVSGSPLPVGARTQPAVLDGVALRSLVARGHAVVTWLRGGHTCVLTGVGTSEAELKRLAALGGGGGYPARAGDAA